MVSAGTLIWVSCRPLLRLVICVGSGFALTKADVFPVTASSGAGQVILNIALPSLMFSKILPSFSLQNVNTLGPLILVGILYELIGFTISWVIKQLFWVPHRFRYGILVAGAFGNYGDIPTAVISTIMGSDPFNGTEDQNLAVAYISAFILVFFITLFPMGSHRLIAWDYDGPDLEDDEVQEIAAQRRRAIICHFIQPISLIRSALSSKRRSSYSESLPRADVEDATNSTQMEQLPTTPISTIADPSSPYPYPRHVSFTGNGDEEVTPVSADFMHSRLYSPAATETAVSRPSSPTRLSKDLARPVPKTSSASAKSIRFVDTVASLPTATSGTRRSRVQRARSGTVAFLRSLLSPVTISVCTAFIFSLVPPLKALFIADVPNTHIPNAPDGEPPLAFVLDTASFIGGASVPLSLICLGSALARLNMPRRIRDLPLGAIGALAVGKTVLMPVLGVAICQGLVHAGVIDAEDKVLRFVCIFFSCLPTATTQVFLTQVYSGTGSADDLSSFLIPQYALIFFSMVGVTFYTLSMLF